MRIMWVKSESSEPTPWQCQKKGGDSVKPGEYLEWLALSHFKRTFPDLYRESTMKEDREEGADCYIGGIPVDVTLKQLNMKTYTTPVGLINVYDAYSIHVGIRYGNRHHLFSQPVIVMSYRLTKVNKYLVEMVDKAIIDQVFDLYWSYQDMQEVAPTR